MGGMASPRVRTAGPRGKASMDSDRVGLLSSFSPTEPVPAGQRERNADGNADLSQVREDGSFHGNHHGFVPGRILNVAGTLSLCHLG